ncbi:hypothetical protein RHSIM_Rhsim06G0134900 [Rhododendron simsii]|uniref:MADS-box domain-containing protein n=1 Tax=Rhododendron simsii TaxID=118357 RepID=A0A834GR44_RHOSS|nr:hypothetical protein RHSIM_Rhsim06G0134900 [Rhododendron simsii]
MLNHIHQWTRPLKRSWIHFQKMLGFWLYGTFLAFPELKRIEEENSRQVSFSKRRSGLMRKASELSVLCDVDIGLFIFSGRGRIHEFRSGDSSGNGFSSMGNPLIQAVIKLEKKRADRKLKELTEKAAMLIQLGVFLSSLQAGS